MCHARWLPDPFLHLPVLLVFSAWTGDARTSATEVYDVLALAVISSINEGREGDTCQFQRSSPLVRLIILYLLHVCGI